ncbi:MAG: Peptidase S11 D-alanyl-D-alanine carboxypeptidase 1 [candidate division WWE3 bacterium GW2011_GWF2_41_45]|uniref:Peptidase S11 D-alanyl-D-alanine carboxypeptidase 1 n=1 Tax=candidate division WWE3 bacterium GW2011_GWC2_41_23 TaxID=1619123 RepID=A0A0G0VRU3_UNCKA|nr:MAG: Peptidase S11 D-alanyl-D-alanine carboxypeptidase 1 [candidate division WWE3 bacterium GW2011_GWC2_41_23]KKS10358.1 MAG: Peptidase S11 D-alanyl-D-alanine carboxypeptidase 1 [candidate division WWE3 bacterium GW2011_GWF2_41_45]KKS26981.1 MAG: serine-type D-Ala-D-Ala carboxypeptidase, D-alanyl-D-alanine carboxypeptidase (penicillin-binding protein 5/6) [candidate division WWE3 bacterium GW2011_GWC1_42_102]KKS28308.1 MAG: Peptidase S11 D-alanyl-D-alanine carboxypeptidase 1 [candidate divisi
MWLLTAVLVLFISAGVFFLNKGVPAEIKVEGVRDEYRETLKASDISKERLLLTGEAGDFPTDLIVGSAGIVVDADTGEILYGKEINKRMPLASLVKIMTAVVTLEHKSLSDYATVTAEADAIGENEMGVSEGEAYTTEELMYGLLLNSGNDAAYTLAENVAGSSEEFVIWMNGKAKELGLKNTEFFDPSGLDDRSYTTAADLVVLTEYAMRHKEFREIVATVEKELPYSELHKYLYLVNQTNLLTTYPGVIGVKTGYTEEAGLCLSTYAENSGKRLAGVVLNSIDRKGDMIIMLDHAFSQYGITVEHHLLDIF